MESWKLKRTQQCKKCPWLTSVNPHEIPNGYCETKHSNLKKTIASGDAIEQLKSNKLNVMACHETDDAHCIGWLSNQLNEGNNIALRIKVLSCDNIDKMKIIGEQHQAFEDTLP